MRPFNRNANVGRGGGGGNGPFISEHLRDLDLELELLKRKREMIEKQQNLLNQQQEFNRVSYNYEQPQSFRNHQPFDDGPQFSGSNHAHSGSSRDSNLNRDFTHLYDEPQQSRNHYPRQSAKKRLGDYVWSDPPHQAFNYEPPAKKPFPQPKKFKSGQGGRPKYVPPSERPGFAPKKHGGRPPPSQRFAEAPQKPRPNDFKPTKVTKPNKPAYPKPSTYNPSVPRVNENSPILHPDQTPSQQTLGRLELALGAILKIVKDKYGKQSAYAHYINEPSTAKLMKQLIRERIRETMLGKPVGNIAQIMQMYRAVYPSHTDKDIVEAGYKKKDVVGKNTTFNMHTGNANPYQFFRRNYTRLLSVSLNKMFARLEKITKEESALLLQSENQNKPESSKDTAEGANKTDEAIKDDAENPEGNAVKPVENAEVPAENSENSEIPAENPVDNAENSVDNAENPIENDEKQTTTIEETEEEKAIADAIRAKYETMLDEVMFQKLGLWLPRYKSEMMKVLAQDITFERAKQAIIKETNVRLKMANEPLEPGSEVSKLEEAIVNKNRKWDYHVKIQGRPCLPKKSIMTEFLKQFNPKMVKKIKNVRNLLYVGFDNRDDFDRIVAADGSKIENVKLIIKISQLVTNSASKASGENTSTPNSSTLSDKDVSMQDVEVSKENNKNDDELNDTLDNQIDELLTSIRNEEESGDNKEVEEAVVEMEDGVENTANENQESEISMAEKDIPENQEDAENDVEFIESEPKEVINLDEDNAIEGMDVQNQEEKGENVTETDEAKDKVEEIKAKEVGKATPVRASTRLANAPNTPSTIQTRRASKLAQN